MPTLSVAHYSGLSGQRQLFGNNGNDKLYGESESDELYGGAGADETRGGTGSNIGDKVVEVSNAGTDTVRSTVSHRLAVNV